jgi:hypothetical protein
VLRFASSAYLARFTGSSRVHAKSDLRSYVAWCADRQLAPLTMARAEVERYVRWRQEVRRFKPFAHLGGVAPLTSLGVPGRLLHLALTLTTLVDLLAMSISGGDSWRASSRNRCWLQGCRKRPSVEGSQRWRDMAWPGTVPVRGLSGIL